MLVLLSGDLHGDYGYAKLVIQRALEFDCKKVFFLGDNGLGFSKWRKTFEEINFQARRNGVMVYFLDGNHDDYNGYLSFEPVGGRDKDGFIVLADHLRFADRGHRWTWEGVSFLACGGAYSIDKESRVNEMQRQNAKLGHYGSSKRYEIWWPTETIRQQDIAACGDLPVDVLLSHDVPHGVDLAAHMLHRRVNYRSIPESEENRIALGQILWHTKPSFVYHGHYHLKYVQYVDWGYGTVEVRGLDCNMNPSEAWSILDLERLRERLHPASDAGAASD